MHLFIESDLWKLLQLIITVLLLLQAAFTKDRFVVDTNYYVGV